MSRLSHVTCGTPCTSLIATSAEALLTRSGRDDNTSRLSAKALEPANAPHIAVHDAARRQTLLFMRTSLLESLLQSSGGQPSRACPCLHSDGARDLAQSSEPLRTP